MLIKFSTELEKMDIYANGNELATIMGKDRKEGKRVSGYPSSKKMFVASIKNPVLVTDSSRLCSFNPTLRDTLFSLYTSKPRVIEYDGTSVYWDDSHLGVWCPSIDTILYANAMKQIFKQKKDFKSGIEIGCGSGFLGKYALNKLKNLKQMWFVDLSKYAIKCSKDNIKDKRAKFFTGDGKKFIKGKKFDFMICNPPYVPRPESIEDNPYEGIGLLYHLVHNGQDYLNKGGVLTTNVSSLAWDLVFDKKPKMKMTLIKSMRVPLKVNNILNNKRWLNYLCKKSLKKTNRKDYEYWQDINIIKLENR